ncbi:hypothetical protein HYFRA_00012948 [Hymenoscyphus fraxineus]|uniref:Uncharacterized protein n=1 Tax=Hymenoscyphus fraxineus TaxID=746836 RepID=A0A9N9L5J3_9HELO|nr:hypothetical protein HYFRA_00012948 [Hymenoscyphus fraxineus]
MSVACRMANGHSLIALSILLPKRPLIGAFFKIVRFFERLLLPILHSHPETPDKTLVPLMPSVHRAIFRPFETGVVPTPGDGQCDGSSCNTQRLKSLSYAPLSGQALMTVPHPGEYHHWIGRPKPFATSDLRHNRPARCHRLILKLG